MWVDIYFDIDSILTILKYISIVLGMFKWKNAYLFIILLNNYEG